MAKKSGFDILKENLQELGFTPLTHVSGRNLYAPQAIVRKKFILVEKKGAYFFASDSYGSNGAKSGFSSTDSGVYIPLDLPEGTEFNIFKKEWLDRFFVSGKKKTGIDYIDKKLTIKSQIPLLESVLTSEMVESFLDIFKKVPPMKLTVQYDPIPYVVLFAGKTLIGLRTNRWVCQKKELEVLLKEGIPLIQELKERLLADISLKTK